MNSAWSLVDYIDNCIKKVQTELKFDVVSITIDKKYEVYGINEVRGIPCYYEDMTNDPLSPVFLEIKKRG